MVHQTLIGTDVSKTILYHFKIWWGKGEAWIFSEVKFRNALTCLRGRWEFSRRKVWGKQYRRFFLLHELQGFPSIFYTNILFGVSLKTFPSSNFLTCKETANDFIITISLYVVKVFKGFCVTCLLKGRNCPSCMKAKTKDSTASLPGLGTKPQHLPVTIVGKVLDGSVLRTSVSSSVRWQYF